MARQAKLTAGVPGDEDTQTSLRSDTEAYAGRFQQARALSREAASLAERNDQNQTAAQWLLAAGLREVEVGNLQAARDFTKEALALASSPDAKILAGLASARSGDARLATALVDELNQILPRGTVFRSYWLPSIEASMALASQDPAGAIEHLRATAGYELSLPLPQPAMGGLAYPAYLRGEAYLKSGRALEAAAEFQKIIDHRGIVLNSITGALAHLQLGRAKAMSGDPQGARKAYDDFFTLWKDADPDVPILKAARAEYARLR
jgi:tetratricopeptide (TPR) repeat protein